MLFLVPDLKAGIKNILFCSKQVPSVKLFILEVDHISVGLLLNGADGAIGGKV